MNKPTIGRFLHYVSRGSADGVYPPVHVPFLVVNVEETSDEYYGNRVFYLIDGWTFNSHGQRYEEGVLLCDRVEPSTCHWPERDE